MLPPWTALLTDAALRKRSGTAVFSRGQAYAASGAIDSLEDAAPKADEQYAQTATVQGTRVYRVRVWIDHTDKLGGECNCPHAQEGHFCKHLVAVCLGWRAQLQGAVAASGQRTTGKVAAAAKSARTRAQARNALQRFVQAQRAEDLAARLWAWAERDRDVMADLVAWQAERNAGRDTKAVRRAIGEMLRLHGDFLDWHDVPTYTERVNRVLGLLAPWLKRDPQALRELCQYTLDCLRKVMDQTDDSEGELYAVMEDVMALLMRALRAAPPPATWVDHWFQRMQDDPWGLWNDPAILAAVGAAAQARYAERACADWAQWLHQQPPTRHAGKHRKIPDDMRRSRLRRRWLDSIKVQGQPRALLDAMTSSIDGASEFLEIIALCQTQGWHHEASRWAQAAAQQHADDWRVQEALLHAYTREGRHEQALALWHRRLTQRPLPETYHATLDAAVRAGHERAAYRAQLHAWAEQREAQEQAAQRQQRRRWQMPEAPTRDISLRISWLIADNDVDAALTLMQQAGTTCRHTLLETLARKLPALHHPIAAQWLCRIFDAQMETATSPYAKPLELVRDILKRLPAQERSRWLSKLRTRYHRKRNFIARLP